MVLSSPATAGLIADSLLAAGESACLVFHLVSRLSKAVWTLGVSRQVFRVVFLQSTATSYHSCPAPWHLQESNNTIASMGIVRKRFRDEGLLPAEPLPCAGA